MNCRYVVQNKEERLVLRTVTNFVFHRGLSSIFINKLRDFQFLKGSFFMESVMCTECNGLYLSSFTAHNVRYIAIYYYLRTFIYSSHT